MYFAQQLIIKKEVFESLRKLRVRCVAFIPVHILPSS